MLCDNDGTLKKIKVGKLHLIHDEVVELEQSNPFSGSKSWIKSSTSSLERNTVILQIILKLNKDENIHK